MASPLVGFTLSGLTSLRNSLRGLSDPENISRMDEEAAEAFVIEARREVPTLTHALQGSIQKKKAAIAGYGVVVGNESDIDYTKPVMAHERRTRGTHFIERATLKTNAERLKIYERGMSLLIAKKGLRR